MATTGGPIKWDWDGQNLPLTLKLKDGKWQPDRVEITVLPVARGRVVKEIVVKSGPPSSDLHLKITNQRGDTLVRDMVLVPDDVWTAIPSGIPPTGSYTLSVDIYTR